MKRGYTDLAVVLGPNVRWTLDDFEDLERFAPEVLLGYDVLLGVPHVFRGSLRGHRPTKVVLLNHPNKQPEWYRAVEDLRWMQHGDVAHWEEYRVHRGMSPVVLPIMSVRLR